MEQRAIGVLGELRGDEALQLAELGHERPEHGDQRAHQLALGLALERSGLAAGGGAEPAEQLRRGPTAAVGSALEEAREALLAQARSTVRRGVGVEEVEGDRGVDGGEDHRRAGPEAVEQGAQLIGQLDAGGDQVIAGAYGGAQRLGRVGRRAQGAEAVAVGAEEVGEDIGIAGIALAGGSRIAGPRGLEGVRMDGHDREAGLDQRIDEQAGRALDRDGQVRGRAVAVETLHQLGQPVCRVRDREGEAALAGGLEHADIMFVAGPIDPDGIGWTESFHHQSPPVRGLLLCSGVGRSHRSLTDRRSGLQLPWRDTLWSVGAFRAGQGSGSHASPHGASDGGSPYPDAEALLSAVNLPHPTRKVHQ